MGLYVDVPAQPQAPDPILTANTQGQINADTARLTQRMNLVDEVGPNGTVRYRRIGPDGTGTGVTAGGTGSGTGAGGQPQTVTLPDGSSFTLPTLGSVSDPNLPTINLSGLNRTGPLANNQIDPYMGLGQQVFNQVRRDQGFTGEFGGYTGPGTGSFETWNKARPVSDQAEYINDLIAAGADPDYAYLLLSQLPGGSYGVGGGQGTAGLDPNTDRWERVTTPDAATAEALQRQKQLTLQLLGIGEDQTGRIDSALSTPLNTAGLPQLMGSVGTDGLPALVDDVFGLGGVGGNYELDNGQIDPWVGLGNQEAFDTMRRGLGYEDEFGGGAFESWLAGQDQATKDRYINQLRGANADPDYLRQLGAKPDLLGQLDALRGRTTNAAFDRLQPQLDRDRIGLEDRLRNQGVMPGSQAWINAMDDLQRGQNDMRLAVNSQGTSELQAMIDMALKNATFGNQARTQSFSERMANATQSNAARSQGLQERAYLQNQPIDQLAALLSGTGVNLPQATIAAPQVGVNAPDYDGNVYNSYNGALRAREAAMNANASTMGAITGLFGNLGAAGIFAASDPRVKRDVEPVGFLPNGLGIYRFRYIDGGPEQVGLMADEVELVHPHAVVEIDGIKHVNYAEAVQ